MIKRVTGIPEFILFYFKKAGQFCCLLFLFSCQQKVNASYIVLPGNTDNTRIKKSLACIDSLQHIVADGDVITRTGIDFTSQALKQFCKQDDTYSHCGIILKENDSFFVYHAIGGELNPKQTLQREWLPWFCDGASNEGIGIFRFNMDSITLEKEKKFIAEKFATGILFDMNFDLKSDDKMYCSEFVAKTLMHAFQNNQLFDTTHIQGLDYFAVDNIFLNKNCREIHRFKYSGN